MTRRRPPPPRPPESDEIREEIRRMATTVRRRAVMTRDVTAAEAAEHLEAEAEAEVPDLEAARRWFDSLEWLAHR